ncbi:MAG: glycerophosphoryl diester phosphodiesterase membrane domain-containing protein [archaeon]
MVKKPIIMLPTLIGAVLIFILSYFNQLIIGDLMEEIVLDQFPSATLFQLPVLLTQVYASQFFSFIVSFCLISIIQLFLLYYSSKLVSGKNTGIGSGLGSAVRNLKKTILFWVFLTVIVLFLLELFFLLLIFSFDPIITLVIGLIFFLITIYLGVHLVLVVPAMALDKVNLKKAISKAFNFGEKHFFSTLLILVLAAIVVTIINTLGSIIVEWLGNDFLTIAVIIVFYTLSLSFINLLLPLFYLENK